MNSLARPIICLIILVFCSACDSEAGKEAPPPAAGATPAEFQSGEAGFTAHCASCHGARAVGTAQGPPLVHKIYEPNHHADIAFQRAALNGVRAHHWDFGNMPKIDGVSPDDIDQIIKYIRWLQRQAGIF
ncbi:MAG TPA: cytochrome c [Nitrospiraceae bacterium]|nr:cytochrome c [Nitrospiraceae bacterium]